MLGMLRPKPYILRRGDSIPGKIWLYQTYNIKLLAKITCNACHYWHYFLSKHIARLNELENSCRGSLPVAAPISIRQPRGDCPYFLHE